MSLRKTDYRVVRYKNGMGRPSDPSNNRKVWAYLVAGYEIVSHTLTRPVWYGRVTHVIRLVRRNR